MINPLEHDDYTQYDYYLGRFVDEEDANGRVTQTSYDAMGRVSQILYPDGGRTRQFFSDTDLNATWQGSFVFLNRASSNPFRRKIYRRIENSPLLEQVELTVLDGMGRVSMRGTSNNNNLDWVRTEYDGKSRVRRVSNPRSLADTTEIPAASNFTRWTTNGYDGLDRITQVIQGSQSRSFAYDQLGRLTSETHPEWGCSSCASGTTSYLYDASSKLTRRTDARGVATDWNGYAGLNRPASVSYSDGTPTVSFTYDSPSAANGKGRTTSMTDGAGSESYHYDAMGRISSTTRTMTGGPTLTGNYVWNLSGGIKQAAFPGIFDGNYPLTIFYDYDNAGRQRSAWWNNGVDYQQMVASYAFNYTNASSTNYAQETTGFSNGKTETVTYDVRLQPIRRQVTPGGVLDLEYWFAKPGGGGNNGNVWEIQDHAVTGHHQVFSYDFLNRIVSATGPGARSLTFGYDRWGNKTQTGSGGAPHKPLAFSTSPNKNRITTSGYGYDNAGNLTAEPSDAYTGRGAMTYAYDGENRIKSTGGSATAEILSRVVDGRRE